MRQRMDLFKPCVVVWIRCDCCPVSISVPVCFHVEYFDLVNARITVLSDQIRLITAVCWIVRVANSVGR